jgi:hypothetical protein
MSLSFAHVLIVAGAAPVLLAQAQIGQKPVVRVRPLPVMPAAPAVQTRWDEKKGPNCIQMTALAGNIVSSPTTIDILLKGGARLRAKLEKTCPSIDFYQGFYVQPSKDGQICTGRDLLHARSGGACEISQFKLLVPSK